MNLANIKNWNVDDWAGLFFGILMYSALILGIISISFAIFSNKQIDRCYVIMSSSDSQLYQIKGNIEWAEDPTLGKAKDFEDANELMLKVCPVKGH